MTSTEFDFIRHNEPVIPEVANRVPKQLAMAHSTLERRVNALLDTANVIAHNQPMSSGTSEEDNTYVGCVVYWNTTEQLFKPARASTHVENNTVTADESAYAVGVVLEKHEDAKTGATSGHIVFSGLVEIDLKESDNFYDIYDTSGVRYLSIHEHGKITHKKPAISIPIGIVLHTNTKTGLSKFYVNISLDNLLTSHRHRVFELAARPAGDWNPGDTVIRNTQTKLDGWLPIDDATFDGMKKPPEAKYGYNIEKSELRAFWPPVPLASCEFTWQRSNDEDIETPGIVGIPEELVRFTHDGIWWLSDNPNYLPWSSRRSYDQSKPQEALNTPPMYDQRLWLRHTQVTYGMSDAVVESLVADPMSGLVVTNRRTKRPASRGDLLIDLDLNLLKSESPSYDSQFVIKDIKKVPSVNGKQGQIIEWGPVVAGIKTDSRSMEVISEDNLYDTEGHATGNVLLRASDSWHGFALPVQHIHLNQVKDANIDGVIGLSFPEKTACGLSGQVYIPKQVTTPKNLYLKLRLLFVAHVTAGVVDPVFNPKTVFSFNYRRISDPPNGMLADFPKEKVSSYLRIPSLTETLTIKRSLQYFAVESIPVPVLPGDVFWFELTRDGGTGGYTGALTSIKREGVLLTTPE